MTTAYEKLAQVTEELERAHFVAMGDLQTSHPYVDPYKMKTEDGRYILLDSLTQLTSARAILASCSVQGETDEHD